MERCAHRGNKGHKGGGGSWEVRELGSRKVGKLEGWEVVERGSEKRGVMLPRGEIGVTEYDGGYWGGGLRTRTRTL